MKRWNQLLRFIEVLACILFLEKGIERIAQFGDKPLGHAAGDIEALIHDAAKVFAIQGFGPTYGLAVYPTYPILSEIPKLRDNHVYAHQFAGPEYILAIFYKVFGVSTSVFQWGRLFLLLTCFGSALLFARIASHEVFQNTLISRVSLTVFFLSLPSMGHWALQWGGQSMAYTLQFLLCAFSLIALQLGRMRRTLIDACGLLLGFCIMYNALPFAFVSVATPIVLYFFLAPEKRNARNLRILTFAIGAGLTAAFLTRYLQLAFYLQSFRLATESQLAIAKLRATSDFGGAEATRIMLIGQYSAHVSRFFNIGSISMVLFGVFFAWLSRLPALAKKERITSLIAAFFASYLWVWIMKNFAINHTHFHPRSFLILYIAWTLLLTQLLVEKNNSLDLA